MRSLGQKKRLVEMLCIPERQRPQARIQNVSGFLARKEKRGN